MGLIIFLLALLVAVVATPAEKRERAIKNSALLFGAFCLVGIAAIVVMSRHQDGVQREMVERRTTEIEAMKKAEHAPPTPRPVAVAKPTPDPRAVAREIERKYGSR